MTDLYYPRDAIALPHHEQRALSDALYALRLLQWCRWRAAGMTRVNADIKIAGAYVRHRAIAHGAELA